ncbi:hypothetical protein WJ0W_006685 [Paenibacillus melissococcoides]|uniref:DUF5983 domain-containing protein n=1 Tax=Paenibacillus melissococcoides TaxID=2912268 RepID=A0ABN8UE63_9BACL|nr:MULTISPECIES: hypothetical protein [Paenibacillus]MEB9895704.1 hypothetical protein [Bacillus cereus]GIO81544.1 hypothetical protein J6TS7_51540 [Paenibacillus dendritiformis]CAH8249500.1 hypothetical protein WJ0W_006685 [Paenibacillus melissococcoides]CAH8721187.1 hypothetical protein HTL2_006233 [Paenibacillus melissococcoides]
MKKESNVGVSGQNISKMMNLSTAHIKKETAKWLEEGNHSSPIVYKKKAYGFWVLVPPEAEDWEEITDVPVELLSILKYAEYLSCAWVMLDSIYDEVEGLPTFEW